MFFVYLWDSFRLSKRQERKALAVNVSSQVPILWFTTVLATVRGVSETPEIILTIRIQLYCVVKRTKRK
jgi:hypothetical protein